MTHKPRHPLIDDLLKYWPMIGVLFAATTGILTEQFIVTAHGKEIENIKSTQGKIWPVLTEQKVEVAEIKTKVDMIYDLLKSERNR